MSLRMITGIFALFIPMALLGCKARFKPLPIVAVKAEELTEEWMTDRKATIKKYKGKRVEVVGNVYTSSIDNPDNLPVISLNDQGADKIEWVPVKCLLPEKDRDRIKPLCRGQTVKIRGTLIEIDPGHMAPCLEDCELLEVGPSSALTVSADDIAEDYIADRDKAKKKYGEKTSIVTGIVAAIDHPIKKVYRLSSDEKIIDGPLEERQEERCYRFKLKTSKEKEFHLSVECCGWKNEIIRKELANIRKGQMIKVRAVVSFGGWDKKNILELAEGVLLE